MSCLRRPWLSAPICLFEKKIVNAPFKILFYPEFRAYDVSMKVLIKTVKFIIIIFRVNYLFKVKIVEKQWIWFWKPNLPCRNFSALRLKPFSGSAKKLKKMKKIDRFIFQKSFQTKPKKSSWRWLGWYRKIKKTRIFPRHWLERTFQKTTDTPFCTQEMRKFSIQVFDRIQKLKWRILIGWKMFGFFSSKILEIDQLSKTYLRFWNFGWNYHFRNFENLIRNLNYFLKKKC